MIWQKPQSFTKSQSIGLGEDFLNEFENAMSRIFQFPEGWRPISPKHRRALFQRFPFGILYSIEEDIVIVSGVMDLRMDPARQKQRISES